MRIFANVIWHFPFLGFLNAILIYILGALFVATGVGSPRGLGMFAMGKFYFAPFSYALVNVDDLPVEQGQRWKRFSKIVRVLYYPVGLILGLISIIQIGLLFISILGIPAGIALSKSLGAWFNPVGKRAFLILSLKN